MEYNNVYRANFDRENNFLTNSPVYDYLHYALCEACFSFQGPPITSYLYSTHSRHKMEITRLTWLNETKW